MRKTAKPRWRITSRFRGGPLEFQEIVVDKYLVKMPQLGVGGVSDVAPRGEPTF